MALLLAVKHINLKSICLHYFPNRSCLSIFSFSMLFFPFPCLLACTRASLLLLLYNTCSRINLVRRDRTDWFIHRFLIPCVPSTYVPYIFQNVLAALALSGVRSHKTLILPGYSVCLKKTWQNRFKASVDTLYCSHGFSESVHNSKSLSKLGCCLIYCCSHQTRHHFCASCESPRKLWKLP